jgi:hypothetical protein
MFFSRSGGEDEPLSKSSFTCLMEAARNRDMGMLDLLLKYGGRDDQNHALAVAAQAADHLVMSKLLALKAHQAGLPINNPPKKAHLKKTTKNVFFLGFMGFFKQFYENNTNISL